MNSEEKLALRVGTAMIIGIGLAAALMLTLDDLSLRPRISVVVHMSHSGGLEEGADVQAAGTVIGEIKSIELANKGGVVLHLRVEKRYTNRCPINGDWFENSKGIFGERYLEVGPPQHGAAWERTVEDGDEIRGIDPPRIDRIAAISMSNLQTMRTLMRDLAPQWDDLTAALDESDRILEEIQPGPQRLFSSYTAGSSLIEEAKATIDFWSNTGTSTDDIRDLGGNSAKVIARARSQLGDLGDRLDRLTANIDTLRDSLDPDRLANFERALDEARELVTKSRAGLEVLEEIAAIVDAGQGTIGGFLHDHELRDFAKRLQRIIKRQSWEVLGHPSNKKLEL